jgi:delta11-fatty-acid desaturase
MLMKILSKYEIPKSQEKERGCALIDIRDDGYYNWEGIENDKFVAELKELVHDHFSNIAKQRGVTLNQAAKATPARWALIILLMASFFGTLPWYISGNWAFLFVTPLLAWVTAVNYWHDGLHFSLSSDWRINAWLPYLFPYYSSPWMWYHEHVIGHHAYPNVSHKDPDLAHAPQLMREHESIKWKPTHVGQAQLHRILFVWSVGLGIGLSLLNDAKANLKSSYNNVVPYETLSTPRMVVHVLGRIGYVFILHIWPYFYFPLWKAVIWATVPGVMLSVCFMVNTQINHLSEQCAHASSSEFFKHQIITAQNFGNDSLFCYYFSGGLNYQIEHHIFPMINHCHLPALSPGVRRICKKYGVPYNHVSGYGEALAEHFAHTESMAAKPQ